MTISILETGEPAPWFSAASASNQANTVALDELAGPHIALLIYGSATQPGVREALKALEYQQDLFDGERAVLVAVASETGVTAPDRPGQHFLVDPNAMAARQYRLLEPTARVTPESIQPVVFVLSPTQQIIDIVPLSTPGAIERVLSVLNQRLANPLPVRSAPVLVVPQVFDREFCSQLIQLYEAAGGREIGMIESQGKAVERFDPSFRKRLDWYISDAAALQRARDSISRRLLPMVYRAFQFQTTRIERYLVGCYDAVSGGHFKAHRDNTAPPVAHRRFAVTINLNEDYEGGYLRFPEFGTEAYRASPGDAIVFSCSLLHEVMPVTRDRRYAFISFFYDEASQQLRDEYMKRMAAAAPAQAG